MDKIKGEQWVQLIGGDNLDYDECSQIVLAIYNKDTGKIEQNFVKVNDTAYPDSPLLEKSTDPDWDVQIFITSAMTQAMPPGTYCMEAKRVIDGVEQPIIKGQEDFMNLKISKTK